MKTKGIEILLNLLFWMATSWLIVSGFSVEAHEIELINEVETVRIIRSEALIVKLLLCIGISFLLFYANLWNLSRLPSARQKRRVLLASALLFLGALALFRISEFFNLSGFLLPLPASIGAGVLTFYFTVSTAYGLGKMWVIGQREQQQLTLARKQAELNLLRNQLQPHFLFNALNNLLSMVDQQQSPQLANAFERLSQLLRYVITETQEPKVSLEREIEFIRNYAALQLLRFEEEEVDFRLTITGEFTRQQLEPGLFIPFVENAFKYGTEPERRTVIELHFDLRQENSIFFSCKNLLLETRQLSDSAGTGIAATRERLQLVYPDKHRLRISKEDYFLVELQIDTA